MNTKHIAITLGITSPADFERIYNKRLQFYYLTHSREVTRLDDDDDFFITEYNDKGNIVNATFDKTYKTGVPIPETDFIEKQLEQVNKVPLQGLKVEHKALLKAWSEFLNSKLTTDKKPGDVEVIKYYPEKYYALYHCLLIEMGKEKPFEKDSITDRYSKRDIINFGKERYKIKTQGQDFYNFYINTDITNKTAIARSYGKGYKDKLIEISKNDSDVITHLKKYPN